jgi:hypothetical protein
MQLRNERAADRHTDRVSPRIAGLRLNGNAVIVFPNGMVVARRLCRVLVGVRGRPVVVVRVIVADVLVHVQKGADGG